MSPKMSFAAQSPGIAEASTPASVGGQASRSVSWGFISLCMSVNYDDIPSVIDKSVFLIVVALI